LARLFEQIDQKNFTVHMHDISIYVRWNNWGESRKKVKTMSEF